MDAIDRLKEKYPSLLKTDYGSGIGEGWYDLVDELISKLNDSVKIEQIKEKFGTLRFYVESASDKDYELINEAETRSATICEVCGKNGSLINNKGWLRTVCDEHK